MLWSPSPNTAIRNYVKIKTAVEEIKILVAARQVLVGKSTDLSAWNFNKYHGILTFKYANLWNH